MLQWHMKGNNENVFVHNSRIEISLFSVP